MKIDLYTKCILTVIGVALCVLAWQGASPGGDAEAQAVGCGARMNPCHVEVSFASGETLRIRQ